MNPPDDNTDLPKLLQSSPRPPLVWVQQDLLLGFRAFEARPHADLRYLVIELRPGEWRGNLAILKNAQPVVRTSMSFEGAKAGCEDHWQKLDY